MRLTAIQNITKSIPGPLRIILISPKKRTYLVLKKLKNIDSSENLFSVISAISKRNKIQQMNCFSI